MPDTDTSPPLGRRGLGLLLASQLLPLVDFSIVNVALDAITRSFQVTPTALALMVAVYSLAFAVCLAMGGQMGDNIGRRRTLCHGVLLFGIASLLCALAPHISILLAARALQGAAAGLIVPQVLATIHVSLRGQAHSRALGVYGAISGLAFIVGQVGGGYLVSADIGGLGWRTIFLINLPVCCAVLIGARHCLPETRHARAAQIDLPGTLLLACIILGLLLPLVLGPALSWRWPCVAMLGAVPPLLVLFWLVELRQERRGRAPLMPPLLLRLPSVRFGLLLAILFFACWSGFMFSLALSLQAGAGLSPIQSGDVFIALGAAYFAASMFSARVVAALGKMRTLIVGCLIQMSGLLAVMLTLTWIWPRPDALNLMPATVIVGIGQAFIVSCFFRIGLSDVSPAQAGAGSAMLSTVQQAAFGLGSALLGAVFMQTLRVRGNYLDAIRMALMSELCLMLLLTGCAVVYYLRQQEAALEPRLPA